MKPHFALALLIALGLSAPVAAQAQSSPPSQTASSEDIFWQSVRDSDDPAMFEAYLDQVDKGVFPGTYAPLARIKIASLRKAAPTTTPPVVSTAPPVTTTTPPIVPTTDQPAPPKADAAAIIEGCDRIAAYPFDPDKPDNVPGVQKVDAVPAVAACLKATQLGDAPGRAFFELGRSYDKLGNGPETVKAYLEAIKRGHGVALGFMGQIYLDGSHGVKRDRALAFSLFEEAIQHKVPGAIYNLGMMYDDGKGVPRDRAKAQDYYQQAIATGDGGRSGGAYNQLGTMYYNARGIPRDRNRACDLWRQGSAAGDDSSTSNFKKFCHLK